MLSKERIQEMIELYEVEQSEGKSYVHEFCPVDFSYSHEDNEYKSEYGFKISVEYQEGGEGQGDHWEVVLKFYDNVLKDCGYMRYVGRYDSWSGVDIHSEYLVKPVKRMVEQTFWESVENA